MEREDEAQAINATSQADAMEVETQLDSTKENSSHFQRDMSVDMLTSPPPTEALPEPPTNLSEIEERRKTFITSESKNPLVEGVDHYLLSGKFYQKFMHFDPANGPSKDDIDKDGAVDALPVIGPIDNSDFVGSSQELSGESETFYDIKEGAQFEEDFLPISKATWDLLVSWYGIKPGSPIMKRPVVNTGDDIQNLIIDLNPPIFTLYTIKSSQPLNHAALKKDAEDSKPKRILASKGEIFQKFLVRVKELMGIDVKQMIRIWKISPSITLGDKSTIDLNAFLAISTDGDREKVDVEDKSAQYAAGTYTSNTFNLHLCGLAEPARSQVVVEVREDGDWPSEKVGKALKKNVGQGAIPVGVTKGGVSTASISSMKSSGAGRQTNSSASSSSALSSSLSYQTRSQTRKEGRSIGTCGLNNLGNTCYMNSALQCLKSVEELSRYFLSQKYKQELNPSNPLSHNGKVATAYASLLGNLFSPTCPSSFAPREFKSIIGKFAPSFSGFGQQDSQEFLAFVLDGLHEDLNRIQKKPYIEKPESTDEMVGDKEAIGALAKKCWDIYRARNDSAVADLFGGQYKSTLVCPECQKVSITFDPFMDLTLPLPLENCWSKEITFVPRRNGASEYSKLLDVRVEMDKNGSIKAMKEFIASRVGVDSSHLVSSEVYRNRFYKHHEDYSTVGESIQQNDTIYVYELDSAPTNHPPPRSAKRATRSMLNIYSYDDHDDTSVDSMDTSATERLLVPVFSRAIKETRKYSSPDVFGLPFFIVVKREEANDYDAILTKLIEGYQTFTSMNLFDETRVLSPDNPQSEEPSEVEVGSSEDETDLSGRKVMIEEDKEGSEGFVDISMKDAVSDSEDASIPPTEISQKKRAKQEKKAKAPKSPSHQLVSAWDQMFTVKVFRNRTSGTIPTAWQGIDTSLPSMKSRIRCAPTPAGKGRRRAKVPGKSALAGPTSTPSESDEDEEIQNGTFEDADNGDGSTVELMNDASDNEDDEEHPSVQELLADKKPKARKTATSGINAASFFKNGTSNSISHNFRKKGILSNRSRESSPRLEDTALIRIGEGIVCDWDISAYDAVFGGKDEDGPRGCAEFEAKEVLKDEELERKRQLRESRRRNGIHLEDCLDEFAREEILSEDDPWYCPRCKEHRRASKTFELWKSPDILVIHLKRFSSSRSFRDKIDALIDFPVEGLDLTNRVGEKSEGKELTYDLIAVDNHYGGLGGGHYTAYAKNWKDGSWYSFDDSSVRLVGGKSVVTPAAYLLFYRRRSPKPLGGAKYEELLAEGDGDSSANGSPSSSPSSSDSPRASSSQSSGEGVRGGVGGASSSAKQPTSASLSRLHSGGAATPINIPKSRAIEPPPQYSETPDEDLYDLGPSNHSEGPLTVVPFSSTTLFGQESSGGDASFQKTNSSGGPHFSFTTPSAPNTGFGNSYDDDEGLDADGDADTSDVQEVTVSSEDDEDQDMITQFPKPVHVEDVSSEVKNFVGTP